jgi:hypothetical protein
MGLKALQVRGTLSVAGPQLLQPWLWLQLCDRSCQHSAAVTVQLNCVAYAALKVRGAMAAAADHI